MNKIIHRTAYTIGAACGLSLAITGTAHATSPTTDTAPICVLQDENHTTTPETVRHGRTRSTAGQHHATTITPPTTTLATQPGGPTALTESSPTKKGAPGNHGTTGMTADLLGSQPLGGHTTGGLTDDLAQHTKKHTADHRDTTPV